MLAGKAQALRFNEQGQPFVEDIDPTRLLNLRFTLGTGATLDVGVGGDGRLYVRGADAGPLQIEPGFGDIVITAMTAFETTRAAEDAAARAAAGRE